MTSSAGQLDSHSASVAHAAPVTLARAWQALALYGPAHSTVQRHFAEFCEATGVLSAAIRIYIEPGRLVLAGEALEPHDLFAPLAVVLQRARLAILDIHGRVDIEQAQHLLQLLAESRGQNAEALHALPGRIAEATGGAVRAHTLSAEHLRLRACTSNGAGGGADASQRRIAMHEMDRNHARPHAADHAQTQSQTQPQTHTPAPINHAATDPAVGAVLNMCGQAEGGTQGAADLECLRTAVGRLSLDQRRQLLEFLGCDSEVPFEEAARILALMPVRGVADAIAVLERPDTKLSTTAMMLMRRLAHLSLGSSSDLDRLAGVAETWVAAETKLSDDSGMARTTAQLLNRLNDTEFRSEEYGDLLQQLSAGMIGGHDLTGALAADDIAQAQQRVVEIVCESLSYPGLEIDASTPLRFLRERCGGVADLGEIAIVRRVISVAGRYQAPERRDSERKAARTLLDAAASDRWMARAIAGIAEEDRIRGVIDELRKANEPAIDVYIAALSAARSSRRFHTLASCRDMFEADELKQAIVRCIAAEPRGAAALTPFIHQAFPADLHTLLAPALLHVSDQVRRQSFEAFGRLDVEWRDDLYLRGLLDTDERVRLATIRAVSFHTRRHIQLIVNRLAERIGPATCTKPEIEALQIALRAEPGSGPTNHIALMLCLLALWPIRSTDGSALAATLRLRPRTALSLVALVACRISPLQIMHRRWSRKGAPQHA